MEGVGVIGGKSGRILDIDLDLFQSERVMHRPRTLTERINGHPKYPTLRTWREGEVHSFLQRAGLRKERPLPGYYVRYHDEVFPILRKLILRHELQPPLDFVHADAHADLGCGDASIIYVERDLVQLPHYERIHPKLMYTEENDEADVEGLSEGNFLLFAIACRWLKRLVYVHHPDRHDDIPHGLVPDPVPQRCSIQIPVFSPQLYEGGFIYSRHLLEDGHVPNGWEPSVEFERISATEYRSDEPVQLAFVAQSPQYTLTSTDRLLSILKEYIEPIVE